MTRKSIKAFVDRELCDMDIDFINPIRKNEPQRIALKATRDVIVSSAEDKAIISSNTRTLFEAVKILRTVIMKHKKWSFQGSVTTDEHVVPAELDWFFRWCMGGRRHFASGITHNSQVGKKATIFSQSLMYECLTDRQGLGTITRHTRNLPLQVAVGLTIHSKTRSKFVVDLVHSLGCSIEYSRVLRTETAIANAVLRQMESNEGMYVPPDVVRGRFIFCAADNIYFLEDTPDGKNTLHATVMTCYQQCFDEDQQEVLYVSGPALNRSLQMTQFPSKEVSSIDHKALKNLEPKQPVLSEHAQHDSDDQSTRFALLDLAWLLAKCAIPGSNTRSSAFTSENTALDHSRADMDTTDSEAEKMDNQYIPTWSAFNSAIQEPAQTVRGTRVCVLPLISSSPTDRAVQLKFLTQLESLTKHVCGQATKCIVTVDMGLYKPIQQLLISRADLGGRWILRPGELHTAFAFIRAVGCFVDGTGIPDLWSSVYSDSTVSSILAGKNF